MPSDSRLTPTAILISNPANDGLKIFKEECRKNRHTLRKALLKDGWNCGTVLFRNGYIPKCVIKSPTIPDS